MRSFGGQHPERQRAKSYSSSEHYILLFAYKAVNEAFDCKVAEYGCYIEGTADGLQILKS